MNIDHLHEIMLHLNIIELYKICNISKTLCNNKHFWKLKNTYDGIQDENIVTLDYIIHLVKGILNLNLDIFVGLPDDREHNGLHELLNLKNIPCDKISNGLPDDRKHNGLNSINMPSNKTYNELIISKTADGYELAYHMMEYRVDVIYTYKSLINKQKVIEILIYLLYYIDDFRYYALPANYQFYNKYTFELQTKSYYD